MAIKKENKRLPPQFFSDKRGEIYTNKIKGTEFNIVFTRAGTYRAGDYHSTKQYSVIMKGKIELTLRRNNKDITKKYGPNELIAIPSGTPHLYKFMTDTVMVEWLVGRYNLQYYEPYRKIIREQLGKLKIS